MAEQVERHLESMTEEIEEMRRTKLFSLEETREILKKRRHFEYKINGVSKNLNDFKDYIQYEKILLKDLKIRRNKFRVADRKNSIEFKIIKRIKYIYEIALQRYSNDFPLYLSYFKFCKDYNYNRAASLIQNMIKNFSYNPEVWQVAAAWYIQKDLNQALNVIHKGLTMHKDCTFLYYEAIQLELLNRDKDDWHKNTDAQQTNDDICCDKIKAYLQTIFKNVHDFHFLLKILTLLESYSFTKSVQDVIIERLVDYYYHEEIVWDALAQRENNGYFYGFTDNNESSRNKRKVCLTRSIEKYKEGLSKIPVAKKSALWFLYLDYLIELQQRNDVANVIKKQVLLSALEEASIQIALEERHFIIWVKLTESEVETLRVLERGILALPYSVELWCLRLKYALMKDQTKEVNQVFKKGIVKLKEKAAPLWLTTLRYHVLTSGNEVIDLIYKDGVNQPKEVSNILKPEYIQWLAMTKGIEDARKTYNLLAREEPLCKELHTTMYKIECLELEQDIDEMRAILRLACDQFGGEDVDVWVNYAEFYVENQKLIEERGEQIDINNEITKIREAAENTIGKSNDGLLLHDLRSKFDVIKSQLNL